MSNQEYAWRRVRKALRTAKGITWDGCHKIYVAMDDQQVTVFTGYDYDVLQVRDVESAEKLLRDWFDRSCGLRFISAVKTVDGDPNDGFLDLIAQFELEDE